MAKILKLVGLKTHIATPFNTIVTKGQTIKISDKTADHLLKGAAFDSANNERKYWEEMPEGTAVDHDLSDPEPAAPAAEALAPAGVVAGAKRATRSAPQRGARATK